MERFYPSIKRITIVVLMLVLMSCATMRTASIVVMEEDAKNVETLREITDIFLKTWKFKSAAVKQALGARIKAMPLEALEAMAILDAIEAKAPRDDRDLGQAFGAMIVFHLEIVRAAIKAVAPDVLSLILF